MASRSPSAALHAPGLLDAAVLQDVMAAAQGSEPPARVLLMRFGENRMRDGRAPVILKDQAHAEAVVAATRAHLGNVRFNFDYDHQAVKVRDAANAGTAKASGWASDFEIDGEGIWASQVEWTPAAAQAIRDGEYRYISPYFLRHRKTGHLFRFMNAALVNVPALELEALAASLDQDSTEEDDDMSLTAIAAALGLSGDADEAAILAAINTRNQTMTAVAAALGVEEGADLVSAASEAVAASQAGEPDPKKYVSIDAFEEMKASLGTLQAEHRKRLVSDAIAAGKVTPAQKGWAESFIEKHGEAEFASYLETAPAIAGGRLAPKGAPDPADGGLTAEQEELCASMGWDRDEYLKSLKEEKGA